MFIFLLFSPKDEIDTLDSDEEENESEKELINEIGEIARDMADSTFQLQKINANLSDLLSSQNNLINNIQTFSQNLAETIAPNTELLNAMHNVSQSFSNLEKQLTALDNDLQNIKAMNIQASIRQELEKILLNNIKNEETSSKL